jgi:hypothetical protein
VTNGYYDRDGRPLDVMEWARLFHDVHYKRVKETTLPNGLWVSTVWLGLDHSFGHGPPLIFETMVFDRHEDASRGFHGTLGNDLEMVRYSTEREAVDGHESLVERYRRWERPKEVE